MQRIVYLAILAFAIVVCAHGQAAPDLAALTPEAAVELAVANNKSLARDRIDLAAAQRALDRSWNGALPGISLSAGTARASATDTTTTYGSVGASLTLTPSILLNVERARISSDTENLSYAIAVRDLELSVRKSYYSLILARSNIRVLEQSVETARKTWEQTEAKRREGMATELDALSARVNLENLKPSLESALVAYDSALAQFKQLLGLDQAQAIALAGSLDEAASIAALDFSGLSGESPAVAQARKAVDTARSGLKAARINVYSPAVALSAQYQPTKSSAASDWTDAGRLSALVSFSLDNLLPWSSARETADKAADSLAKAQSALEEAVTSADIKVRSLQKATDQSLASLKALRLTVQLAERKYTLTEEAHRYGTKDLLALQDAEDSLLKSRVNLLKEAYNLLSNLLDLEYALGVPFGTLGR